MEEVAVDPARLSVLDQHTRRVLANTALAALNALFYYEVALAADNRTSAQSEKGDRLLNFKQTAVKLGKSLDWLYRHHKQLPVTVQLGGGRPGFSETAIEEYIRKHRII